jgi:hypothetical protein
MTPLIDSKVTSMFAKVNTCLRATEDRDGDLYTTRDTRPLVEPREMTQVRFWGTAVRGGTGRDRKIRAASSFRWFQAGLRRSAVRDDVSLFPASPYQRL